MYELMPDRKTCKASSKYTLHVIDDEYYFMLRNRFRYDFMIKRTRTYFSNYDAYEALNWNFIEII